MYVTDFEYDHKILSSMGYMICSFNGGFNESVSNGSIITLNTTQFQNGARHELTSSTYQECLTATFSICKNPCVFYDDVEFAAEEIRILMRWLNRRKFLKFRFLEKDYVDYIFNATFTTINRVEAGGKCIGLELTMQTDKPYGYFRPITKIFRSKEPNWKFVMGVDSDESTSLYAKIEIVMYSGGKLEILNETSNELTSIRNCSVNEIITMDYPMISSRASEEDETSLHDIPNDFNWNWFRIVCGVERAKNKVSVNLPCKITMTYQPIVKMGLI